MLGYPEKFELALRYGEAKLMHDTELTDADRLLLDALSRQAQHGPCKEPRPSMFDSVARARHSAWVELGNRSKMEAMFMYVQAVEALSAEWWRWPELGLVTDDAAVDGDAARPCANGAAAATQPDHGEEDGTAVRITPLCQDTLGSPVSSMVGRAARPGGAHVAGSGSASPTAAAKPRQKLLLGGWTQLEVENAPARYRHACAVVGARLFVFGGRCNSGRLAGGLHVLDLLTGVWSSTAVSGTAPELRWGHSMNSFRQWVVVFGGHRQRGCFDDATLLDTQAMAWAAPRLSGALPPARGNHAAAVCMQRLWLFGGDAPPPATVSSDVWCLPLSQIGEAVPGQANGFSLAWEIAKVNGTPPPPSSDHTATACASRILLLGGSGSSGYVSFGQIWLLDVEALAWASVRCSGAVPRARAGHGAAAVQTGLRGWDVYVFGGGASATGFDDLHVLDEGWKWQKLDGAPAEPKGHRPPATEGMGMAVSGSLLLVCGGYTATGASCACLAWGCERTATGALPVPRTPRDRKAVPSVPSRARETPAKTLLLLACPGQAPAQAHAQAAQAALMHGFTELQVVPVNGEADGGLGGSDAASVAGEAGSGEAVSQEQALAMLQQRMEAMQLQWRSLDGNSSSLLSQAQVAGAVQPCRYKLMAAGRPRTFTTFWVGLIDLSSGRTVAAASASREVPPAAAAWGRAAASQAGELDTESAVIVTQAWRALVKSW